MRDGYKLEILATATLSILLLLLFMQVADLRTLTRASLQIAVCLGVALRGLYVGHHADSRTSHRPYVCILLLLPWLWLSFEAASHALLSRLW